MSTQTLHLGTGALTEGLVTPLDLGPEHPTRTGLLLLDVEVDGSSVASARLQPGLNHRATEKLFEVRDYRQVLVLADRHDWHSPFTGELGVALVCEHLMGLVPPQRATWLRTLLAEHARATSHLAHLSFVGWRLGDEQLQAQVHELREQGRALMLAISGNRVHPMLNRLGGLAHDVAPDWIAEICRWLHHAAQCGDSISAALDASGLGMGIATADAAAVDAWGLSGPAALAAGLQRDLRAGGYLGYGEVELDLDVAVEPSGDAAARFQMLCRQLATSARIADACVERLAGMPGPVDTKLSKIIKVPDSQAYLAIEAPWGIAGFHLVSRAERTPWRLKLRTPGFANLQALEALLPGTPLDQLDVAVASLGWTNGEVDR